MNRIVRRVETRNRPLRSLLMRLQEQRHQHIRNRRPVMDDLAVPGRRRTAQLQPVQRRLPRNRSAVPALRAQLPRQHCHHRIGAQHVMIDQVVVPQRNPEHTPTRKRSNRVLHEPAIAMILETSRKAVHKLNNRIRLSEQQSAGVRSHRPAIEIRHNRPSRNRLNGLGRRGTLRSRRGTSCPDISSWQRTLYHRQDPDALKNYEKSGLTPGMRIPTLFYDGRRDFLGREHAVGILAAAGKSRVPECIV